MYERGGGGRPRLEGGKGCSKAPLSLSRDAAPEFNRLHFETILKLISPPEFSLKPATLPTPLGAGRLILFKACKAGNIRLRFIGRSVVRTNESPESLQTRETIRSILSRRGLPVISSNEAIRRGGEASSMPLPISTLLDVVARILNRDKS